MLRSWLGCSGALAQGWRSQVLEKSIPDKDADAHFLSFCRRRGFYKEPA
jgi:hypothetical protein